MRLALINLYTITITLIVQAIIYGQQYAAEAFPTIEEPSVLNILAALWGGVVFFLNLITFDVPGAPWYIRLPVAVYLGGGLFVSVLVLARGGGGET